MVSVSNAGPGEGTDEPKTKNVYRVTADNDKFASSNENSQLVVMWDGNEYSRDNSWMQIDEEAACNLGSYV